MQTNKKPLFTIGIPVYNSARYLEECLNSIIKQDIIDFEIICLNDCSTDDSLSILNRFSKKDSRIKVLHHEKNEGILKTRFDIVHSANGKYFIWCDSDDKFKQFCLKEYSESINDNAENNICLIHNADMIKETGTMKNIIKFPRKKRLSPLEASAFILFNNGLKSFPWIFVLSTDIAKKAFDHLPESDYRLYVDDALLSYRYPLFSNKVVIANKSSYEYFWRNNSDSTDPKIIKRLYCTTSYLSENIEPDLCQFKNVLAIIALLQEAIYYSTAFPDGSKYSNLLEIKKTIKIKQAIISSREMRFISKKDRVLLLFLKWFPHRFYSYYSKKTTRYSKGDKK